MAVKLFKLVGSATTNTTTVPTVNRYFHSASAGINDTKVFFDNSDFFQDDGTAAASALVTKTTDNGFYQLFVNGEMQQSGFYTVAASGVTLEATPAFIIPESAPITLAVTNFAPISSTVMTV